jgi:uncharacterized protein
MITLCYVEATRRDERGRTFGYAERLLASKPMTGPVALLRPLPPAHSRDMTDDPGVNPVPEHTCWKLLRSVEVARLAVSVDDRPDIFPLNFVVDHGTVVFRTGEGSKFAAMMSNPEVAFEVDGYDSAAQEAWSVVIHGRAEEIKQLHERIESMDLPLFPWQASPKPRFVRVVPELISGRRFHVVDSGAWDTPTRGARRSAPE